MTRTCKPTGLKLASCRDIIEYRDHLTRKRSAAAAESASKNLWTSFDESRSSQAEIPPHFNGKTSGRVCSSSVRARSRHKMLSRRPSLLRSSAGESDTDSLYLTTVGRALRLPSRNSATEAVALQPLHVASGR
jgi:hypothetical protein